MRFEIDIGTELLGKLQLGVLTFDEVSVREADPALTEEIDRVGRAMRERYPGLSSGEVAAVVEARSLYKALGIDPTKTRPSSESLLRRVLKGEALYRVNTLVDAVNLCSLEAQLPFGLYDLARIQPPVVLRRGMEGEAYPGIRKDTVNVDGRPTLADQCGPFGNPTSDSCRTMITLATGRALVTVYAPVSYPAPRLSGVLDATEAAITRYCGGIRSERAILPER